MEFKNEKICKLNLEEFITIKRAAGVLHEICKAYSDDCCKSCPIKKQCLCCKDDTCLHDLLYSIYDSLPILDNTNTKQKHFKELIKDD